jgi:hypothetical protein
MSHTPGNLAVSGRYIKNKNSMPVAWMTGQMMLKEKQANARRLVACWNACEGLETDQIDLIADSFEAMKAQRDELLAALKTINSRLLECAANPVFVNEAYDSFYQEIVNAAIATAEGTTP